MKCICKDGCRKECDEVNDILKSLMGDGSERKEFTRAKYNQAKSVISSASKDDLECYLVVLHCGQRRWKRKRKHDVPAQMIVCLIAIATIAAGIYADAQMQAVYCVVLFLALLVYVIYLCGLECKAQKVLGTSQSAIGEPRTEAISLHCAAILGFRATIRPPSAAFTVGLQR